jgi:hypothetical protein
VAPANQGPADRQSNGPSPSFMPTTRAYVGWFCDAARLCGFLTPPIAGMEVGVLQYKTR